MSDRVGVVPSLDMAWFSVGQRSHKAVRDETRPKFQLVSKVAGVVCTRLC